MGKRSNVYNRIYNEEDWNKVNKENKYMIEDFLEEYRQRQKKEGTIKQYFNDLRIISIYILKKLDNRPFTDLQKKDFRRMNIWMQDRDMSNARVNRLMSAVRSMLNYIEDDDEYQYENNVARKIHGLPKEAVRTNEEDFFLSFEQVMVLRKELLKQNRLQDAVLLMILYDSGARRNEVFQVEKHGLLDGNKTNIVVGKRGKKFPLIYLDDTKELIKQYLEKRGEDDIDSLWIKGEGKHKEPITSNALYGRVVSFSDLLSEIEGKEYNFFVHSFRHSRCEALLQGLDPRIIDKTTGKPKKFTLEEVQVFLHHSDPKTTLSYAKDHTEETIDNMFGL